MKNYPILLAASLLLSLSPAFSAELPDFYRSVDALLWVVDDVEESVEGWKRLGFGPIQQIGEMEAGLGVMFQGESVFPRYRLALGRIGETAVYWVKPLGGEDAISGFMAEHGAGIMSLMHRLPSLTALDEEVTRLKNLGVGVLQRAEFPTSTGRVVYVLMDTEPQGKYVLGLYAGDIDGSPLRVPPPLESNPPITQYAFAVHDLQAVSDYWARLGFPEFEITEPGIRDLRYKDEPGDFQMRLGWQRHGDVPYEWTQSLKGPNVYLDHLDEHGEGIHHIAFNVADMDEAVERWVDLGFPYSMGGAWGEKGRPGSGRFVYVSAQEIGGTDVELLWNYTEGD